MEKIIIDDLRYTQSEKPIASGFTSDCYMLTASRCNRILPERYILKQLKTQFCNSQYNKILEQECNLGQRINSPFLAHYKCYLADRNATVIEYVNGLTLKEYLIDANTGNNNYFTNNTTGYHHVYSFCKQVLKALHEIHSHGIYHCDLTINNVMIRKDTMQAVVIDMGMACTDGHYHTFGTTQSSCPPEMRGGRPVAVTPRIDVYMFGNLLRQITAGGTKAFDIVIEHCMQENPSERYPNTDDVLNAVESIYCKNIDDTFLQILSQGEFSSKIIDITNNIVYCENKIIGNVEDLSFFRNNPAYLEMLTQRHNLRAEAKGKEKKLKVKEELETCEVRIFDYESSVIQMARNISICRNKIDSKLYDKVLSLFLSGDIANAKRAIDTQNIENCLQTDIDEIEQLYRKMKEKISLLKLYAQMCLVDLSDPNRYETAITALDGMIKAAAHLPERESEPYYTDYGNTIIYFHIPRFIAEEHLLQAINSLNGEYYPSPRSIRLIFDLAESYCNYGSTNEANAYLKSVSKSLKRLKSINNDFLYKVLSARLYYYLAKIHYRLRKYESANKKSTKAIIIVQELIPQLLKCEEDSSLHIHLICDILNQKGDILLELKEADNALKCYNSVFVLINEMQKQHNVPELYASIQGEQNFLIGNAFYRLGYYFQAIESYRTAIDFFSKNGQYHTEDLRSIITLHKNSCFCHVRLNEFSKAEQSRKAALTAACEYQKYHPEENVEEKTSSEIIGNLLLLTEQSEENLKKINDLCK